MKKLYATAFLLLASFAMQAQTLVAHYDFNNCSTTDLSPNGLNLTAGSLAIPTVSPVCTTGAASIANTARYFNGSNWYYTAHSSKFELDTWTLSAVVNFHAFDTTNCQVSYILGSDRDQGTDGHYSLETNDNNFDSSCAIASKNKQQFFGMSRNTTPVYYTYPSGNYLTTEKWYCLTATYDGTDVRTYIDGTLAYVKTWSSRNPKYSTPNPLVFIGTAKGGGSTPYFFDGRIDDIEIWSGVRTPANIATSCNAVKNPTSVKNGAALGHNIGSSYPNPVTDVLTIPVQNLNGQVAICVYAIDGRLMQRTELSVTDDMTSVKINTDKLMPGMYILSVGTEAEKVSMRFSKQ